MCWQRTFAIIDEIRNLANYLVICFLVVIAEIFVELQVMWHPSSLDCAVLNVDGSFLVDSSRVGFGGVLRNENGSSIMGFNGCRTNSNNTNA